MYSTKLRSLALNSPFKKASILAEKFLSSCSFVSLDKLVEAFLTASSKADAAFSKRSLSKIRSVAGKICTCSMFFKLR